MSQRAYLLPDVIDPGDAVCIRVFIPDDPLYIAAFWGAYEYLTAWLAWERDDAKRGKDAAAVWKPYFEQARIAWELALGECGVVDVRVSPTDDCVLEKTINGVDWVAFADIADCVQPPPPPPYPVAPPGETGAEAASDDLMLFFMDLIDAINRMRNDGDTYIQINAWTTQIFEQLAPAGTDVSIAVTAFLTEVLDHTDAEITTALADGEWEDFYQEAGCEAEADGHWLDVAADNIFDWLNAASLWIFQALGDLSDLILDGDSLTRAANLGQGGGGAGFGSLDCTWTHTFDFVPGAALDWVTEARAFYIPTKAGIIGAGGWASERQELSSPGGTFGEHISIKIAFLASEITSIEVTAIIPAETFISTRIIEPPYGSSQPPDTLLAVSSASGTVVLTWTGSMIMTGIGAVTGSTNGGTDSGVGNTLEKVVVEGKGPDPFS